ncbi:MAG TPA: TetR/AcrR family transcriptional regulator [Solirubrobacteraceae bacterium]|nr:TetR/AcrR family transcriptional regulator [Solirubrobacteraceae bacterium]
MGTPVRGTSTKRPSEAGPTAVKASAARKPRPAKADGARKAPRAKTGALQPRPAATDGAPKALPAKGTAAERYRRLPTGAHSLDPEDVRRDQRERLQSALIELIAERGYQAVRILDLTKLARVSRPTFYSLYTDKEELFLAAYDETAERGERAIAEAYGSQGSPPERLRAAMRAFAELAAAEPEAVSLLVLGAFGAGPKAFERRNRTLETLEQGIARVRAHGGRDGGGRAAERKSRSRRPAGRPSIETDLTVRMVLGGIREVTAARLRQHRAVELPGLARELTAWAGCYPVKPPAGLEPPAAPRRRAKPDGDAPVRRASERALQAEGRLPSGRHDLPRHYIVKNQRERIVDATAEIVAEKGLAALTIPEIARRANVSHQTFYEMYPTKQDAFLGAQKVGLHQALGIAVAAYETYTEDWPQGVAAGIGALLDYLASEPAHAHLTVVDTFAASPLATEIRDTGLHAFAAYLQPGFHFPAGRTAPEIAPEAVAGGVWQILHHYIAHDRLAELPCVAPQLAYFVLTPFLGAKEAAQVARKSKTAAARK